MKYQSFKGPIIFTITGFVLTITLFVIFIIGLVNNIQDETKVFSGSPTTLEKGSNIELHIENNPLLEDATFLITEKNDGSVNIQFIKDFDVVLVYNIIVKNSETENTIVIKEPYVNAGEVTDELTMIGTINISSANEYVYNIEVIEGVSDTFPEISYHYDYDIESIGFIFFLMMAYLSGVITVLGSIIYFIIISSSRNRYRFNEEQKRIQLEEDEYYKQFITENQNS